MGKLSFEKLKITLQKSPNEFKNESCKVEFVNNLLEAVKEPENFINQFPHILNNPNVITNLVYLLPLTSPILKILIRKKGKELSEKESYQLGLETITYIRTLKRDLRMKERGSQVGNLGTELAELEKEVAKFHRKQTLLEKKLQKQNELKQLKTEIKRLERELGSLEEYQKKKKNLQQMKEALKNIKTKVQKEIKEFKDLIGE